MKITLVSESGLVYGKDRQSGKTMIRMSENFKGVFVSDFYTGYDSLNCVQQKCLIHLMRDINNALFKDQLNPSLRKAPCNPLWHKDSIFLLDYTQFSLVVL